ncbi:MAG TPA: YqgE/AlgH family protein [Actinomycetes bacterium]|nr:YqgE/AlgH family protein [Actinomycetes bacterium]
MSARLTGRLLVATPLLVDPNFRRTVVLILDHDEDGSLGVVVNRPTTIDVASVLEQWAELTTAPGVVFQGGPVALDSALGLAAITGADGRVPVEKVNGVGSHDLDGSLGAGPGTAGDSASGPGSADAGVTGNPADREPSDGEAHNEDEEDEPLGWRRVRGRIGLIDLDAPPQILAAEMSSLRIFAGYAGWGAGQLESEIDEGAWYVVDAELGDAFVAQPEDLWRAVLRRQPGELAFVATFPDDPSEN